MSLLAYAIAVTVTGLAARALAGDLAGVAASMLMASSGGLGLTHAATSRPYALVCALAATATFASLRVAAQGLAPNAAARPLLVVVSFAGLLTHPTFAFLLLAIVGASLLTASRERSMAVARLVAIALLSYAAIWGWMVVRTLQTPATSWMTTPTWFDLAQGLTQLWGTKGLLILLLAGPLALMRRQRVGGDASQPATFLLAVAIGTVGLAAGASLLKPVYTPSKTPILVLPALSIALAYLLVTRAHRLFTIAAGALFMTHTSYQSWSSAHAPDPYPTSSTLRHVLKEATCGDLLVAGGWSYMALQYNYARLDSRPCSPLVAFPGEVAAHPAYLDPRRLDATPTLRSEAATVAARLVPGGRIWLFTETHMPAAAVTRAFAAEPSLRLAQRESLKGTSIDEVVLLVRR
jgi:hypothetical protein